MTTKVLVTGAGGYIGRHVVTALLNRRADVVAIERPGRRSERAPIDPRASLVELDIFEQREQLLELVGDCDVVVHLAWEAGFVHNSPVHMERLGEHFGLLRAAAERGVKRIAVMGSMHEVGFCRRRLDNHPPAVPLRGGKERAAAGP